MRMFISGRTVQRVLICVTLTFAANWHSVVSAQTETEKWRDDLRVFTDMTVKGHKNAFHTITRKQFDDAVSRLSRRVPTLKRHEIIVELARIVAMVGDGHTRLQFYRPEVRFRKFPITLYSYPDGIYVQAVDNSAKWAAGLKLVSIGGESAEKAFEKVAAVTSRDNEYNLKEFTCKYMAIPEVLHALRVIPDMDSARFTVDDPAGKQASFTLPAKPMPSTNDFLLVEPRNSDMTRARDGSGSTAPLWLNKADEAFSFEYLPAPKVLYVQFTRVENKPNETFEEFCRKVFEFAESNPVDKFVIDLRLNTGGNSELNGPLLLGLIRRQKIDQYGKLFVIIGRRTFSAAGHLLAELEQYTNAIFVGEPAGTGANHFGENFRFELPNSKITVTLSSEWWQKSDPRDIRTTTFPELTAELTAEDYRTNRDPALEVILNYTVSSSLKEQLLSVLDTTPVDNRVAALKAHYLEYKLSPLRKYFSTEKQINDLGYELMAKKRLDEAIEVFKLNVVSYPGSANSFDSLAAALEEKGDKIGALSNYRKALEIERKETNRYRIKQAIRSLSSR